VARVVRNELRWLMKVGDQHHTLLARLAIALGLTVVVDVIGAFLIWGFERHARGTEIHDMGDAFFFATVQLLTVSSQLKNPLTAAGRVVDVVLELWAIAVVTALAGSFSSFFRDVDQERKAPGQA
jgi:Ion channel